MAKVKADSLVFHLTMIHNLHIRRKIQNPKLIKHIYRHNTQTIA